MAEITLYTKSWCPYCQRAKALLDTKGQPYEEIDLEAQPEREREMRERAGATSVPQIWIGERHIGGCDDLHELDARGELDGLLT